MAASAAGKVGVEKQAQQPEASELSDEHAYKNTPRLPYMGLQQLALMKQ